MGDIHMSINSNVTVGRIAYSALTDSQRGTLLTGAIASGDMSALQAMGELVQSDTPVSDEHAVTLKMVRPYVLGLSTGKRGGSDVTVYRPIRRGGTPQNLDAWVAGLTGASCNIDPDTVIYVRDIDGNEVTVITEDSFGNEIETPLAEVRGDKNDGGTVSVRTADGRVWPLADGRKVTLADVGEDIDIYMSIREFSRDGGDSWESAKWTLTLPRPRKNK